MTGENICASSCLLAAEIYTRFGGFLLPYLLTNLKCSISYNIINYISNAFMSVFSGLPRIDEIDK